MARIERKNPNRSRENHSKHKKITNTRPEMPAELLDEQPKASKEVDGSITSKSAKSLALGQNSSKTLSRNILSMKFMQRMMEEEERKKILAENKKLIKEANWVVRYTDDNAPQEKSKFKISYETSYLDYAHSSMEPSQARMSFGDFNQKLQAAAAEVEKKARQERIERLELEKNISAEEMAMRFAKNSKKRTLD